MLLKIMIRPLLLVTLIILLRIFSGFSKIDKIPKQVQISNFFVKDGFHEMVSHG